MTNADKIRQMSNDELAELMDDPFNVFSCNDCKNQTYTYDCDGPCLEWIKKWLNEEYTDG